MFTPKSTYLIAIVIRLAYSAFDIAFEDDSDLTSFYTRPDIKAPILEVNLYDHNAVTSGYFFVAPYADIRQQAHARNYYQACQTGPAIYDMNGYLIWSGACSWRNQNTCDFRTTSINGSDHLSAIRYKNQEDRKGHGIIMDSSFQTVSEISAPILTTAINMHEFLPVPSPQGTSVLMMLDRMIQVDVRAIVQVAELEEGWILDTGFRDVDIATGKTLFEWWPSDHISLNQSTIPVDELVVGPPPKSWSWFHANSIDKNADGDYLLNSRWTNAMYKISGGDGSIVWQLGGEDSSFVLDGFNFSRQHDARWISYSDEMEVISFLDNGACPSTRTSNTSSALIVALDKLAVPPTARVLSRIWRPDGRLSVMRGNYQVLSDTGNTFVGWSENAYMTEHAQDGRMLLEARFLTNRFVTYRSYKFNFTSSPMENPVLKAFVYGESEDTSTSVAYVSWNGATEVAAWKFYSNETMPRLLGSTLRSGFETMFQVRGYYESMYAEAIDPDGHVLGRSNADASTRPADWDTDPSSEARSKERIQDISDQTINSTNEIEAAPSWSKDKHSFEGVRLSGEKIEL